MFDGKVETVINFISSALEELNEDNAIEVLDTDDSDIKFCYIDISEISISPETAARYNIETIINKIKISRQTIDDIEKSFLLPPTAEPLQELKADVLQNCLKKE